MPQADERTPFRPTKAAAATTTRADLEAGNRYPARLVENYETEKPTKSGPMTQWFQAYQRLDMQWADGNTVERYNTFTLVFPNGGKAGKGSEAYALTGQFEKLVGCTMLPADAASEKFIGHVFLMEDVPQAKRDKDDPAEKTYYSRWPVQYLGDQSYVYNGVVRTLESRDGSGPATAEPAESPNLSTAAAIADMISGMQEADVRAGAAFDKVINSPQLDGISTVLGMSVRGGLISGGLLDKLVEAGLVEIRDGVVYAEEVPVGASS